METLDKPEALLQISPLVEDPAVKKLRMSVTPLRFVVTYAFRYYVASKSINPHIRQTDTLFAHFAIKLSTVSFVFLQPRFSQWIIQPYMTKSRTY